MEEKWIVKIIPDATNLKQNKYEKVVIWHWRIVILVNASKVSGRQYCPRLTGIDNKEKMYNIVIIFKHL